MAASRRSKPRRSGAQEEGASSPAQEDEADIIAEVGAERAEELDELVATKEQVVAIGAVDAESVRENRRLQTIVDKKRGNMKDVPFNAGDILTKFEWTVKMWPPNTLHTRMKRLTGTPVQHIIMTFPRSAAELYAALMEYHGVCDEAKYEVVVVDSNDNQFRAKGQITLPDTQPKQSQGGYPMNAPQYQQQAQSVPPQGASPQAQQPQQAPPPQVHVVPPPQPDPMQMFQQFQQMWEMMQQMQPQQQPPQQQAPPPQMPPPPPAHADLATMMQWMQQMFQKMQPQPQQSVQTGSEQSSQADPMAAMRGIMGAPPMTPPPGTIWVPGFGFMPLERLAQVFSGGGPGAAPRGPYRPPYSGEHGHAPYTPPAPPAPVKSAAEQFQEAVSVVRTAVDAVKQVDALLPRQQAAAAITPAENDDSPVQIIDTGPMKILVDKKDGTLRPWETGWANMPKMMDWIAEQREAIQNANSGKQEEEEETPKQLPPGYVEVKEGYQPPPGMVAVKVDPSQVPQAPLPPPPANTPPPLQSTPPSNRTWEMPTIPTKGEG